MKRWENMQRDGTRWWVEIESDMFDYEDEGLIVSVWTENTDSDDEPAAVQTLIMASPEQARGMAEQLRLCADHVERWHREHPAPRVLDESPLRGQSEG